MSSFIKEESGRIPGRLVISAVKDEKVIWQKETDFRSREATQDTAARKLQQAQRESAPNLQ